MIRPKQFIDRPIAMIVGHEPDREGEYPSVFKVGIPVRFNLAPVDLIEYREANYGDHAIGWFDVHAGSKVIASMAARAVSEIHYQNQIGGPGILISYSDALGMLDKINAGELREIEQMLNQIIGDRRAEVEADLNGDERP